MLAGRRVSTGEEYSGTGRRSNHKGARHLFMPTNLTKGIDVSDDPILITRTEAYAESYGRRTK
jgi:hypothetical protein